MSKALAACTIAGGLASLVGVGAGIYGIVGVEKEIKSFPDKREKLTQEYEAGNKTLEEYNIELTSYAQREAHLSDWKIAAIIDTVVFALGVGVFTWGTLVAIEEL